MDNRKKQSGWRWHLARIRAKLEGVQVRRLSGTNEWIATSGTDPDVAYRVTPYWCECPAAQFGDEVCKHRAALIEKLEHEGHGQPQHHAIA